jgi:hypothetical protein
LLPCETIRSSTFFLEKGYMKYRKRIGEVAGDVRTLLLSLRHSPRIQFFLFSVASFLAIDLFPQHMPTKTLFSYHTNTTSTLEHCRYIEKLLKLEFHSRISINSSIYTVNLFGTVARSIDSNTSILPLVFGRNLHISRVNL